MGGIPGTVPSLVSLQWGKGEGEGSVMWCIQEHWLIVHPKVPLYDIFPMRQTLSHEQTTLTFRLDGQPH